MRDVEFLFFDDIEELPPRFDWTLYTTVIVLPGKYSGALLNYLRKLKIENSTQSINVLIKSIREKMYNEFVKFPHILVWEASESLADQIRYIIALSNKRSSEQQLLLSQSNDYRDTICHFPDGILVFDRSGIIVESNDAFLDKFHYTADTIAGHPVNKVIPGLSIEKLNAEMRLQKDQVIENPDFTFLDSRGFILPCTGKLLLRAYDNKEAFILYIADRSDQLSLRRSLDKRNDLISSLSYVINLLSGSLDLNFRNPNLLDLLKRIFTCDHIFINTVRRHKFSGNYEMDIDAGNDTESTLLTKFQDFIHSNFDSHNLSVYHPNHLETLTSARGLKIKTLITIPLSINENVYGVINLFYLNYFEPEDFLIGFIKLIGKIIALSEVKAMLWQDTEKQAPDSNAIIENALDGIYQTTPDGRFLYANPALIEMLGYESLEEMKKLSISDDIYVEPEAREIFKAQIEKYGHVQNFVIQLRTKQRKQISVLEQAHTVHAQDGSIYYEGFIRDISHFRQLEEQLQQSEYFSEELIDQADILIIVLDKDRKIIIWNKKAEIVSGFSRLEMIDRPFFTDRIFTSDDVSERTHAFLHNDELQPLELKWLTKAGKTITISMRGAIMHSVSLGETEVWFGTDITHEKQLEESLIEERKMERLFSILISMTNTFDNLLKEIQSEVHYLKTKHADPKIQSAIARINKSLTEGIKLRKHLYNITHIDDLKNTLVNPNTTLSEMVPILSSTMPSDIEIVTELKNSEFVEIDTGRFSQVFFNLAVNAIEAMPEGGKLTIQTTIVKKNQDRDLRSIARPTDRYIKITFSDNGSGMKAEETSLIFEPFYTTKPDSPARGLGMTYVYRLITMYNGHISVESQTGIGTSVNIYLPVIRKQKEESRRIATPAGKGTILVIDDEVIIRELLSDILKSQGYRVLTAENGKEGIKIYKSRKKIIDLIILDIIMPEMDGKQVYEKIKSLDDDARVLITSGYSKSKIREELLEKGVDGFLPKPFDIDALLKQLDNIL